MSLDLLSKKGPPPDTASGLLLACHERIRFFCRLAVVLASRPDATDEQIGDAAQRLCAYFGRALPLHSQDEDISVRPRLEAAGVAYVQLEQMTGQHEHIHALVDELLLRWEMIAKAPGLRNAFQGKLIDASERLVELFDRHLSMEEEHIFPHLDTALTKAQERAIVREMRERRRLEGAQATADFRLF